MPPRRRNLLILLTILIAIPLIVFRPRPIQVLNPYLKTVADDPPVNVSPEELSSATDFTFALGDGSGWHGYDVIKVDAAGQCEYTFHADPTNLTLYRRATFVISPATLTSLKRALVAENYFGLKKQYHHTGIADGTQRFIKVQAAGKQKGVYCNNYFPDAFERVRAVVDAQLVTPNRPAIGRTAIDIVLNPGDAEPEDFTPRPAATSRVAHP